MKLRISALSLLSFLLLTGCGGGTEENADLSDNQLDQITAAKTPYALTKSDTPLLNSTDWDGVFGGADGNSLRYDRFGEIDDLVFVAAPKTPLNLQRQIRHKTRLGVETIYYKVTTPDYTGEEPLWVDGRFLELQDVRQPAEKTVLNSDQILETLRIYVGLPYTWHGSSADGAPRILDYYPPAQEITMRSKNDWILKGFDSLGMLYRASAEATPLDLKSLMNFGQAVFVDLATVSDKDEQGNTVDTSVAKAKMLMAELKPLDIITYSDRIWVVLDHDEVIESRYRSKFDGGVKTGSLYDTLYGLLQKGTFVKDPFQELEDKKAKKIFIRRFYAEPAPVAAPATDATTTPNTSSVMNPPAEAATEQSPTVTNEVPAAQ